MTHLKLLRRDRSATNVASRPGGPVAVKTPFKGEPSSVNSPIHAALKTEAK
jgi:hypothetical protein